jgi:hypothetical protein
VISSHTVDIPNQEDEIMLNRTKSAFGTMVIAAFVMACLVGSSAAEVMTFKRAGGWEAFAGRSNDGRKLCGMAVSGGGRWFGVKYFEGNSSLTIQLSKNTWKVRSGEQIDVIMQFDNESLWKARATAFHMDDGDAALEFQIDSQQLSEWLDEFQESTILYVRFPSDNVEDWQADLSGTQQIAHAMGQCLQVINTSL